MNFRGTNSKRSGYTLVELLLVLALVSVLVALSISGIESALAIARNMQCVNNLHQIGTAHKQVVTQGAEGSVYAGVWPSQLLPQMENDTSLLFCPNGSFETFDAEENFDFGYVEMKQLFKRGHPVRTVRAVESYFCQKHNVKEDSFEFWFESGSALDWNDFRLRFDKVDTHQWNVTVTGNDNGDGSPNSGHANAYYAIDGTVIVPESSKGSAVGACSIITVNEVDASYGMNSEIGRMDVAADKEKVILIEYNKAVANLAGPNHRDDYGANVRPRHSGVCNVLFMDGAVKGVSPVAIDPNIAKRNERYWLPNAMLSPAAR